MATKKDNPSTVEAFLLRDCVFGKCGEVVDLSASDAEQAKAQGMADLNPDAVKAARG